jgi:hypothetical protein
LAERNAPGPVLGSALWTEADINQPTSSAETVENDPIPNSGGVGVVRREATTLAPELTLLDHLVRAAKEGQRNGQTEHFAAKLRTKSKRGLLRKFRARMPKLVGVDIFLYFVTVIGWMNPYPFSVEPLHSSFFLACFSRSLKSSADFQPPC